MLSRFYDCPIQITSGGVQHSREHYRLHKRKGGRGWTEALRRKPRDFREPLTLTIGRTTDILSVADFDGLEVRRAFRGVRDPSNRTNLGCHGLGVRDKAVAFGAHSIAIDLMSRLWGQPLINADQTEGPVGSVTIPQVLDASRMSPDSVVMR